MAGKKRDFSDIYDAIREAEKEGRTEDVTKLVAYLETESAKPSEDQTYDPRDKSSGFVPAGIGAAAAAVATPLHKSAMREVTKASRAAAAPVGSVTVQGAPAISAIDQSLNKGFSNAITQHVRESQVSQREKEMAKILAELKSQGVPVNPKVLAEMPTQAVRPGQSILLNADTAKEIEAAEATKKAATAPKSSTPSKIGAYAKGVYDYKLPFVGSLGSLAGRTLLGAGAGFQAQDAFNRGVEGDTVGKYLGYIGAAGTGASALPLPMPIRVGGGLVGGAAELINMYRDAKRKGLPKYDIPEKYEKTGTMAGMYAEGGPVQHYFLGGSVTSGVGPMIGAAVQNLTAPIQTITPAPQGTTPIMPTQPAPLSGTGVEMPTYDGSGTVTQMFGGMPQGTTPIMPVQQPPKNFGTGVEMPTYDGSGSVMQMFGGTPQGTTPVMPVQQPPRNFGTGAEMPTYDGSGSVMQVFGGMPQTNVMPKIRQFSPQMQPQITPRRPQNGGMPTYMQNNAAYEAQRQRMGPYTAFPNANQVMPQRRVTPRRVAPVARMAAGGSTLPEISLDAKSIPNMTGRPGVGYMETPQGVMARLQIEKELKKAKLRAGVSGAAMAIPGQHGVKLMPGQMDVGANMAVGPGELDVRANRSINPIPGKGYEQGLNARYTVRFAEGGSTTPAWQREEGKNPEGGLNAIGRASYNRETGGNLKAPQPEGGSRKDSFCARMGGMKKKLTSSKTANDPDSRINKALRKWKC